MDTILRQVRDVSHFKLVYTMMFKYDLHKMHLEQITIAQQNEVKNAVTQHAKKEN